MVDTTFKEHLELGVCTVGLILFGLSLLRHFRSTRGQLIYDAGPHPQRWLFLRTAVLNGLLGVTFLLRSSPVMPDAVPILMIIFSLPMALMASGRLQVRSSGLRVYWALVSWERLENISWLEPSTLVYRCKSQFLPGEGALLIPAEHKVEFEQALSRKR